MLFSDAVGLSLPFFCASSVCIFCGKLSWEEGGMGITDLEFFVSEPVAAPTPFAVRKRGCCACYPCLRRALGVGVKRCVANDAVIAFIYC